MNSFFELLQVAIGARERLSQLPRDRAEWEELLKVCGKHNLIAITFPVIDALHDEVEVPLGVYSRWAMMAEKVRQKNSRLNEGCKYLSDNFTKYGFRSCVLKGQGVASLYPDPSLRQCGDVDIWLEGTRRQIVDFCREHFEVKQIVYHHIDVHAVKGINVEVHFTPSWMNSPVADNRLQKYFASRAGEQFSNRSEDLGFCMPTNRFNAVYLLIHIYRHVLDEGIGLRQLLDYYYTLKALTPADRQAAIADIKMLKLEKFAAGVMALLVKVFAMPEEWILFPPDGKQGEFLLGEIMVSGNFGRYDERNAHSSDETRVMHAKRKMTRSLRYISYYPEEVLCIPVFMVRHYFWRLFRGYL